MLLVQSLAPAGSRDDPCQIPGSSWVTWHSKRVKKSSCEEISVELLSKSPWTILHPDSDLFSVNGIRIRNLAPLPKCGFGDEAKTGAPVRVHTSNFSERWVAKLGGKAPRFRYRYIFMSFPLVLICC
jgi:hypothetical protein